MVGIYLSAHPLDDYEIVLRNLCNTHCTELATKEALIQKDGIILGGIVTGVKSKFTKNGNPCGFVTIEDFEGSGELAFFGEEWGRWRGMLSEGCIVYITAKCQQRYRDSNIYDLRVQDIQYMQTVKEKRLEKITLSINSNDFTDDMAEDLSTLIEDTPGKVQFYVQIFDPEHNDSIMLRSKGHTIDITHKLLSFIKTAPGITYHVN